MSYGLSLAELEAEGLEVLPERNTMSLIEIGSLTLLNGLNVLNGNNIGAVLNVIADNNESDMEQKNSSNDLVTCVVGLAYTGNDCSARN